MERINEARAKITEESLKIKGALATFIEETINEHCTTEEVANKILDGKKSIKDLINDIRNKAKEKAVNNMAAISDEEVRGMVLKYFEIDETKAQNAEVVDILDLI
ncbi:Cas9 inhibitor AcrIIA9 family protein [Mogibacterium neglectum]|uniref:Cas9 inhibitor AcrIIA9 family protein n=1 Tax=Mogibacterium neglectum TaxID=114528 RepID=UPI0027299AE0|nr:Cas9 inhibitor AcrIIA9 family protein [Mogibacterium neglectum]WLD76153.1 Cas9 inhibitor AcrIIA9 family protein [Mogibacterium neglectum]